MRLPIDMSQWGMLILRSLIQQIPSLEPYIQLARILQNDPEGNAFGVVPLTNGQGFIPFIVRGFELKPTDVLITSLNGEQRFQNLSEATAISAMGGIGMGTPITQTPPGVSTDQPMNFLPPYMGNFGMGRRGRPDVQSSMQSVKLSSLETVEAFLKEAASHDPALPAYLAQHWEEILSEKVASVKAASERPEVVVLDPTEDGWVDIVVNGHRKGHETMKAASIALRANPDGSRHITSLMKAEPVVLLEPATEKTASAFTHVVPAFQKVPHPRPIKEEGWYKLNGHRVRAFQTRYLDGSACSFMLAVSPEGHNFGHMMMGVPADSATSEELKLFYQPADLVPGELAFILHDKSGEASVPFIVRGSTGKPSGEMSLTVEPLVGKTPTQTIHFGNNQHPYMIGTDGVALPKKGYSVFKLNPKKLGPTVMQVSGRPVTVRVIKGAGVYSIKEGNRPTQDGLTRGQVLSTLIERYGMDSQAALEYLKQVGTYTAPELHVTLKEEAPNLPAMLDSAATKMACLTWDFARKLAAAYTENEGAGDPNASGPNRPTQDPGVSGPPSAGGMMPVDQGAGILPAIPGLQEVSDMLTSYAMGAFAPDELSEIYNSLVDKLGDVQDLAGRILTLVRLGKVDFITENEAKRLLDESDKFRASLMNADMLLKGVTATI